MPTVEVKSTNELGITGLKRSAGIVLEEFLPALQGRRAAQVFTEMTNNDAVTFASSRAIKLNMRSVKWRVDPGSSSRQDRDYAKYVDEVMNDMNVAWMDFIDEAMSSLDYGWAYHEMVLKQRKGIWATSSSQRSKFTDGYVGVRKLPIRSQDSLLRWEFDPSDGSIDGMWQMAAPDYQEVFIPMTKSLLFRTTTKLNNPEGQSIFRGSYRSWFFKKRIEEIEGIGVERDLAGLPFAQVDPQILSEGATDDEKALLAMIVDLVKKVRRDQAEGIIFPTAKDANGNDLFNFSLLSSGGSRQFETNQIITRYCQHQTMTTLTDFLMLGNAQTGSFALSNDKTSLFTTAIGSYLDALADVLNRHLIPRLFKLNNWTPDKLPNIRHEDIDVPDLGALGSYLTSLAGVGVPLMPDDELENYLRAAAHLPAKSAAAIKQQEQAMAEQQQMQFDQQGGETPPPGETGGGGWGGAAPKGMAGPYPPATT